MSQGPQPQTSLQDLVQDLDLNRPLHELVEDPAILKQPVEIDQQELAHLDALAREYVQELRDQGRLPDTLPMDIDPRLLEPAREIDLDIDFGR